MEIGKTSNSLYTQLQKTATTRAASGKNRTSLDKTSRGAEEFKNLTKGIRDRLEGPNFTVEGETLNSLLNTAKLSADKKAAALISFSKKAKNPDLATKALLKAAELSPLQKATTKELIKASLLLALRHLQRSDDADRIFLAILLVDQLINKGFNIPNDKLVRLNDKLKAAKKNPLLASQILTPVVEKHSIQNTAKHKKPMAISKPKDNNKSLIGLLKELKVKLDNYVENQDQKSEQKKYEKRPIELPEAIKTYDKQYFSPRKFYRLMPPTQLRNSKTLKLELTGLPSKSFLPKGKRADTKAEEQDKDKLNKEAQDLMEEAFNKLNYINENSSQNTTREKILVAECLAKNIHLLKAGNLAYDATLQNTKKMVLDYLSEAITAIKEGGDNLWYSTSRPTRYYRQEIFNTLFVLQEAGFIESASRTFLELYEEKTSHA